MFVIIKFLFLFINKICFELLGSFSIVLRQQIMGPVNANNQRERIQDWKKQLIVASSCCWIVLLFNWKFSRKFYKKLRLLKRGNIELPDQKCNSNKSGVITSPVYFELTSAEIRGNAKPAFTFCNNRILIHYSDDNFETPEKGVTVKRHGLVDLYNMMITKVLTIISSVYGKELNSHSVP